MKKFIKKIVLFFLVLSTSSCIHVEIKKAGVFKDLINEYDDKNYILYIDIPVGLYGSEKNSNENGSKIGFGYLGSCGAQLSFTGILIPIVPFFLPNFCKSDGFYVGRELRLKTLGVTLQLRYNNITYDPYIDNGSVKFKITDFKAFKKAPDKTLIIHKKKPDGTIFTKELPFDWKIVTEVSGGL